MTGLGSRNRRSFRKITCLSEPFPSPSLQACSSRDAVRKEGAVIFFTCSTILQMLSLVQIMIMGIHGDSGNIVQGHDQDQDLAVPAGKGHVG